MMMFGTNELGPLPGVGHLIQHSLIESFGYRQITVVWRLKGIWDYLRGVKSWGAMQRAGFAAAKQ